MSGFVTKYSPEQKEAVMSAYIDRGIRPRARILELAAAGQLPGPDGEPLPPFTMPDGSAAAYIRDERKRRVGRLRRDIAAAPARDAIEQLRRRCVSSADALLDGFERNVKSNPNRADPERLRQIVRVVREAAALPGVDDPRPNRPGAMKNGERNGAETKASANTLAGGILRDVAGTGNRPGQPSASRQAHEGEAPSVATQSAPTAVQTVGDGGPGSLKLALSDRIAAASGLAG